MVKTNSINTMKGNYTWQEILDTDFDTILKNVTSAKDQATDAEFRNQLEASIDMHTQAKNKQNEILSLHPELKNYQETIKKQMDQMNESYSIATQISIEEKKLYQSMYENLKADQKLNTKKNPCKDFVL